MYSMLGIVLGSVQTSQASTNQLSSCCRRLAVQKESGQTGGLVTPSLARVNLYESRRERYVCPCAARSPFPGISWVHPGYINRLSSTVQGKGQGSDVTLDRNLTRDRVTNQFCGHGVECTP